MSIPDKNFLGIDSFIWFFGIIESRQDPLGLGRVKVRCYGWHTDSLTEIPSDDLPWAQVIQAPNDRMFSTPREADLVFGFFADGENGQAPVIVGVVPGYFTDKPDTGSGFHDLRDLATLKLSPRKPLDRTYKTDGSGIIIKEIDPSDNAALGTLRHPQPDELDKESISGVTRYQNLANTVIKARKSNLDKDVKTALGKIWSEPYPAYNPLYPYNNATETESGHVFELDDTPGHERIHFAHRSGSYVEWFPTGTKVEKITKSAYQIIMGDDHMHIMGKVKITVDSDAYIRVVGNTHLQVENNLDANVSGDMKVSVGGALDFKSKSLNFEVSGDASIISATQHLTASGELDISGGSTNIQSGGDLNLKGSGGVNAQGGTVNLKGGTVNADGGTLNLKGGSTLVGGGSVDIAGTVKIDNLTSVNKGASSPGGASGAGDAAGGTTAGLADPPAKGTPTSGSPAAEKVPVPIGNKLIDFDPETGTAYKHQLFLDTNPDGTLTDPGANTANVAKANANVSPCMFDANRRNFITSQSLWSVGDAGLALIRSAESFAKVVSSDTVTAYPDPITKGEPIAIGYGSTASAIDKSVSLGDVISRATAENYLVYAINKKFMPTLQQTITVGLTQEMIDACISLMYNIGTDAFAGSTLAKKINSQDWCAAADQFLVWNKAKGIEVPGLSTRRKKERTLFLT